MLETFLIVVLGLLVWSWMFQLAVWISGVVTQLSLAILVMVLMAIQTAWERLTTRDSK